MSRSPFTADVAVASRIAALEASMGPALRGEIWARLGKFPTDPAANLGLVLPRGDVEALMAAHGITDEELMLLIRPLAAQHVARPPVSAFQVGAVAREASTGHLLLGGNLEFVGASIHFTVHGEGFLAARAHSRGQALDRIALSEAHPCGHCRQFLSEFAWAPNLVLIDPLGHRLALSQLYPWPFDPAYLGDAGAIPGRVAAPQLRLAGNDAVSRLLVATGARAHAPYSNAPAAIVLTLSDGTLVAGGVIESVAFNPSLTPLQSALVDLLAHGRTVGDIAAATLAVTPAAPLDQVGPTRALLAAVAPAAPLTVVEWAA